MHVHVSYLEETYIFKKKICFSSKNHKNRFFFIFLLRFRGTRVSKLRSDALDDFQAPSSPTPPPQKWTPPPKVEFFDISDDFERILLWYKKKAAAPGLKCKETVPQF